MDKSTYWAFQAVNNCLKVQKDENVIIITDKERLEIWNKFAIQAQKITNNVKIFVMEDYWLRDDTGLNPLKFPQEIAQNLEKAQVSIFCGWSKKWELETFRSPMINIIKLKKIRHWHMPWITPDLMEIWMCSDYQLIQEMSAKIYEIVHKAQEIRVTSEWWTNFVAQFNPSYKWVIDDWNIKPWELANLPAGEVFTCIDTIQEWIIIIDWVLGDHMKRFWVIEKTPLTLHIKDSRVIEMQCENQEILQEMINYIKTDENSNRIWEFAIWTNIWLEKLSWNLLQDEKFPWVHVALGHWYPQDTGSDRDSKAHMDMVIQKVDIIVDWKKIMEKWKFII